MDIELLHDRAEIIRRTRAFFDRRGYLETDTPLLAPDLIPESCLEVFETTRLFPRGSKSAPAPYWLIPSPEVWMKRLIAQHHIDIYQICKCFRNGESSGKQHSPEFTMLEYYTMKASYLDSIKITEELFGFLLDDASITGIPEARRNDLSPPFIKMPVEEAFDRWAGFDLYKAAASPDAMENEAKRLGLNPLPGLSVPELYDLIFIHSVEPKINLDKPVILMDYPAFVPCLAKKKPGGKTVERWELYAHGTELANCFSEETNALVVRGFFETEKSEKEKTALVLHNTDNNYWKIFGKTETASDENLSHDRILFPGRNLFPDCSGVALGMDRLIMVLLGKKTLAGILPFSI